MHRPPLPPFTRTSALDKVQSAEDAWNTRDPEIVIQAYTPDCVWRNRHEIFQGHAAILFFLRRKWETETNYKLMKELWTYTDARISVRFEYEWQHLNTSQWYRSHGNEHWEFNTDGYMTRRDMSANDIPINANQRRIGI